MSKTSWPWISCGGLLVFLRKRYIAAEEHCVVAMDVRHDVPVGVCGVGVLPGEVAGVHSKTASAVSRAICVANRNSRDLVRLSELCWEQRQQIDTPGRQGHVGDVRQDDMVGRVASDKFVQQVRFDCRSQANDKTGCRPHKVGVGIVKRIVVNAPERTLIDGRPRIVDVSYRQPLVLGKVLVYADQFFPPIRRIARVRYVSR